MVVHLPLPWLLALCYASGILTGAIGIVALCLFFSWQEGHRKKRRREVMVAPDAEPPSDATLVRICPIHGAQAPEHVCDYCLPVAEQESNER